MSLSSLHHILGASLLLAAAVPALAVSCKTQAALTEAERTPIVDTARQIAADVQAGRTAELKAATVPSVAANFTVIQQSATALTPLLNGSTLTVNAVYRLDAADAKAGEDQTEFFCDSADNRTHVTFGIQHLPPGQFAFAIVHATGGVKPQQLGLLLEMPAPAAPWQLAGFFPKPLTVAGRDGLWYWKQARTYAQRKQGWNAWLYYSTAAYLLQPAGFFSSTNLEKLNDEQQAGKPAGLPGEAPLTVKADGADAKISSLRTDDQLGGLDLVVHYDAAEGADPVAARSRATAVMKALLALHPELREAFHGIWAFADSAAGTGFSLELPMRDLSAG